MSDPFSIVEIRPIKLVGGPCDGLTSIASHLTAIVNGEIYVWGGNDHNEFFHASSQLDKLPHDVFAHEIDRMMRWIDCNGTDDSLLEGIPEWRANAWLQVLAMKMLP